MVRVPSSSTWDDSLCSHLHGSEQLRKFTAGFVHAIQLGHAAAIRPVWQGSGAMHPHLVSALAPVLHETALRAAQKDSAASLHAAEQLWDLTFPASSLQDSCLPPCALCNPTLSPTL